MSLHLRSLWISLLIHHNSFGSATATASIGRDLAICDGIVPINDSVASIRGPRIRKRASGSQAAARLWAGRTEQSEDNLQGSHRTSRSLTKPPRRAAEP